MSELERARSALSCIPADDRDLWVRMGMAIHSEFGEAGFDLWDEWGQQAENYDAKDSRVVWKGFDSSGGITIATLYGKAKEYGWIPEGNHRPLTPEEAMERERNKAERAARDQEEKEAARVKAEQTAATVIHQASPAPSDHPYLASKGIEPCGALAISTGDLVIPLWDAGGKLHSLQLINGEGMKRFVTGGRTKGCFFPIGEAREGEPLYICEGFATGASIHEATLSRVYVALNAGNLLPVATDLRALHPGAEIVICADDDAETPGNPGLTHAVKAARAVGGKVAKPDFGGYRREGASDFNDMAQQQGGAAVRKAIQAAEAPSDTNSQPKQESATGSDCGASAGHSGGQSSAPGNDWPEPQPLTAKVEPEPYPLDALPDVIRGAVEEVAGFVKAPVPLVASSALAALSLACQAHANASRDAVLISPIALFLMAIANSGERKTQADKMFMEPIIEYQDTQAELAKPLISEYKAKLSAWEAEREGILSKIRALAKEGKPVDKLRADLAELELEKPEPPRVPKLVREDATPEGLAKKLEKEWPSAGVISNEAGIVFGAHGMNKESVMRNLALLNKLWDGGRYQSDRSDDERSRDVRGARLTMGLMIQESTLRAFFDASKGLARGTGFLARFLVAWPSSTMGTRFYTPPPAGNPALTAFHERISDLLRTPAPINQDGILTPPVLSLTAEAKAAWVEFHDAIEAELASGGEFYDVQDVASKSADNAVRLAAIFQTFERMGGAISRESFDGASLIAAWHLHEARRFFGEIALPKELADATRLESWLIEHCKRSRTHEVSKGTALQYGPLRSKDAINPAITELTDLDRLRVRKDGKRITLQVNPALLGPFNVNFANSANKRGE